MCVKLEARDEGRHCVGSFRGGSTIWSPAGSKTGADVGRLLGRVSQIGKDSPAVTVLRRQGRGFVVVVKTNCGVPQTLICSCLDTCSSGLVASDDRAIIQSRGEGETLVQCIVQD